MQWKLSIFHFLSLLYFYVLLLFNASLGKIQGENFLGVTNIITIIKRGPIFFFLIYFCLWLFRVGVTDCKWRTKPTKCCKVSGLVKQATAIKNHGKCTEKIAIWERWVVSAIVLPKSALRKRSRCYWETRSNVKRQHASTRTDNPRQKYVKKLTFCCGF